MRVESESPIVLMKACKNPEELAGMRNCHIRDGAAMAEFLAWLEEHLSAGHSLSEVDIDLKVTESRASFGMFLEPSFATIAGVNGNGAIIHYRYVSSISISSNISGSSISLREIETSPTSILNVYT